MGLFRRRPKTPPPAPPAAPPTTAMPIIGGGLEAELAAELGESAAADADRTTADEQDRRTP